jgi:phosphoesterase RecJ-like protein
MVAFEALYKNINPTGTSVLACDDVSKLSVQVLQSLSPDTEVMSTVQGTFDLVVLLDSNSIQQVGVPFEQYLSDPSRVVIIDHHADDPDILSISENAIVRSDRYSTCELLVDIYGELGVQITPRIANLLLTGMLFDTRRFFYADRYTFDSASLLIGWGADYPLCIQSLIIRADRSERIARLKAASRVQLHQIGQWLVVTARVGAFEASACRGLIDLGADVAIVGGKPAKDVVRISSRSTNEFYQSTGISLGTDIMAPIGDIIGGKGGGHANAAGANGVKERKAALAKAVELIKGAVDGCSSPD